MALSTALGRYRLMAYVVGVMLIVVFASIPFGSVEKVVGPVHGALYLIYLATVLHLWIERRLPLLTVGAMVAAGWVPFVAFAVERYVSRGRRGRLVTHE